VFITLSIYELLNGDKVSGKETTADVCQSGGNTYFTSPLDKQQYGLLQKKENDKKDNPYR